MVGAVSRLLGTVGPDRVVPMPIQVPESAV